MNDRKNGSTKKKTLVLHRETLKELVVSTSIRTGVVIATSATASIWCPHTAMGCHPKTGTCTQ